MFQVDGVEGWVDKHLFLLNSVAVFLFVACYFYTHAFIFEMNGIYSDDMAATELRISLAKSFEVLSGPYSRYGFDHLGPISFYLFALSELLTYFGLSSSAAHCIFHVCFNFFAMGITSRVLIFYRPKFSTLCLCFLVMSFFVVSEKHGIFFDYLGPYITWFGSVGLLSSVLALHRQHIYYFGLVLFFGAMVGQNHLLTLPVVGILTLYSLWLVFWRFRSEQDFRLRNLLFMFIFGLLLYFPIITDLILNGLKSNPARIYQFILTNQLERLPTLDVLQYFIANSLVSQLLQGVGYTVEKNFYHTVNIALFFMPTFLLIVFRSRQLFRDFLKVEILTWIAILIICSSIRDRQVRHWYGIALYGWVMVRWVVVVSGLFLTGLRSPYRKWQKAFFKGGVHVLYIALVTLSAINFSKIYPDKPFPVNFYQRIVQQKYQEISSIDQKTLVQIEIKKQWQIAAGVADQLVKHGIPICTNQNKWLGVLGQRKKCHEHMLKTNIRHLIF